MGNRKSHGASAKLGKVNESLAFRDYKERPHHIVRSSESDSYSTWVKLHDSKKMV